MADLSIEVDGLKFDNPFVIGSGPPGSNAGTIKRAFKEGWGGVSCKTIQLEADKIKNVAPRYARLSTSANAKDKASVYGFENIELTSDRAFSDWLDDFKDIKDAFGDDERVLTSEIPNKDAIYSSIGDFLGKGK